ncbi:uncharacterized protein METZ01_LOCUS135563 [marine metagenome]|uniref:Uncharacterized protein n=1 Tax=marine metagenome TaxID=408172 RepID=A0A381Z0H7_9ZZZZ|tara:strand:- start:164 stop:631 length:468 start_codon:yes stop_codon:yes gene_type:complete
MIDRVKKVGFLFLAILLVSFLVGAQTTVFNLIWLSSVDMPVTFGVLISSIYHDFVLMTLTPAPPAPLPLLPTIISLGLFIAFGVTWIVLRWAGMEKKYAYGIAGAMALVFIVYLMPLLFFGVDMLAGARSTIGKISLIICGYLGGHFFGSRLSKV